MKRNWVRAFVLQEASQYPCHLPVLSSPDVGLFRAPGPGLGNLLFPVARALIAREKLGGTLVRPTMRQIKIGTYLRRERDKRTYGRIFRHRSAAEMLAWARCRMLASRSETEAGGEARVIRYEGMRDCFHGIEGHSGLVRAFLEENSARSVPRIEHDIAMHVRLGDFAPPGDPAVTTNTQLPLDWYRDALQEARRWLGPGRSRGILFSDERPERIIERLGLEGFTPEPEGNALTSVLLMAQARLIICSHSTFSMWGQYLGNSVAIWPRAFDLRPFKPESAERDIRV